MEYGILKVGDKVVYTEMAKHLLFFRKGWRTNTVKTIEKVYSKEGVVIFADENLSTDVFWIRKLTWKERLFGRRN